MTSGSIRANTAPAGSETSETAPEPNGLSLRTTCSSPGCVGGGKDFTEYMAGGVTSWSAMGAILVGLV